MTSTNIRSYHELSRLKTFEERYEYLKMTARIGEETFGTERFLNQYFYGTPEWRALRQEALIRDQGCDLGIEDHPIGGRIEVHHINPITAEDIKNRNPSILDLDNVICVSSNTHKAIHYGDASLLPHDPIERKPNDTCPWKL